MRSKEFREIQVSSSALVVIFLGVLVLGVFIFLLGVSVGKKQAQMTVPSVIIAEKVTPSSFPPAEEPPVKTTFREETPSVESGRKADAGRPSSSVTAGTGENRKEESKPVASTRKATFESSSPEKKSRYYIQVGAFTERDQASALASKFKEQGYSVVIFNPLPTDRKTIYRVRLGGYADGEQASLALAKLNSASRKKTGYYTVKD